MIVCQYVSFFRINDDTGAEALGLACLGLIWNIEEVTEEGIIE